MKIMTKLAFVSALALGIAACSSEDTAGTDAMASGAPEAAMSGGQQYTYDETQQRNLDGFNEEQFQRDYNAERDARSGMAGNNATGSGNATGGSMATGATTDGTATMPARANMDFAYLDRNGDGKLSVAEYAIWAVDVDPTAPKSNDATRPYVTADQANEAARSFFYFDKNGDTYLDQSEFQTAKAQGTSAAPGGGMMATPSGTATAM